MPSVSRPSILLVEADVDTREMYAEYLALSGFDVVGVGSGKDALSRAFTADIIITGLRVPGIDGLEILRKLRENEGTKHKLLIVLTACADEANRQSAHAAGGDLFLAKPCSPQDLVMEVRRAVTLRSVPRSRPVRAREPRPNTRARAR